MCVLLIVLMLAACASPQPAASELSDPEPADRAESAYSGAVQTVAETAEALPGQSAADISDGFAYIEGGTFEMGSPDSEAWRSADERQHKVTVSSFWLDPLETTQVQYEALMGENPSQFSGSNLPVENISWLDAVRYANARSAAEGLDPVYEIEGTAVSWDRSADGYRLPTEAEWEYACRAGTLGPFNTDTSISPDEANYYGHYPYEIEEHYFDQSELTTKPGTYRQATVAADSFPPNAFGLYNMHGNVAEWTWDLYGPYPESSQEDPAGPQTGSLHVYRGGGWNDFAKNLRSAYRAAMEPEQAGVNTGIRLARNAANTGAAAVAAAASEAVESEADGILIAYYSWGGNTRAIAQEISAQTGADLFEITLVEPYSTDYNTVLDQAQQAQREQARPEIAGRVDNMEQYDTVLLGYPNWWASIPMPIASFLESYDFAGKTIVPFCSHGGGRFGQSLTAIAKLVPDAHMGEPLSVHYSGGATLDEDIHTWLEENGIPIALG